MSASYSPLFIIDIDEALAVGQTATITALGIPFELVSVNVVGGTGCRIAVTNNGNGAAVAYFNPIIAGQLGNSTTIIGTYAQFDADATIVCTAATEAATRVQLICRAIDSRARAVTVVVA